MTDRADHHRRRAAFAAIATLALAWAVPLEAHSQPAPQLVVRYRSDADGCAPCPAVAGRQAVGPTGSPSFDALARRFGVRAVEPAFARGPSARAAAWRDQRDAIRARFPERAARRSPHAGSADLSAVFVLDLADGSDVAAAAAAFAADPDVVWAEPVQERSATYLPNDPYLASSGTWGQSYGDLWGLHAAHAPAAWDVTRGEGIVVAVVDTGIHPRHRDLEANLWQNAGEIPKNRVDDDGNGFVDDVAGWDFVRRSGKVKDKHGHGTHVAGTVGAVGDDLLGVAGMAYRARLMNVRGLDERGIGRTTDLARAIDYAAANGADVINCSWGGFGISNLIADAVVAATDLGVVVVFAAGNDGGTGHLLAEANLPQVIAAAASDVTGARAGFSNYGDAIAVAAPGVDILSTRGSSSRVGGTRVGPRYLRLSGTSMAAPHVAGLAALVLSADPTLTTDEVRWHLELNADQPGYPGWEGQPWNPYFGWGRIDAARAFDPPPVTTRLRVRPAALHAFADAALPDLATMTARFTTTAPVAWSFAGSPWAAPAQASGSGDASIAIGIDATGIGAGTVTGTVGVAAPDAADGGAAVDLVAHLHQDDRVGPPVLATDDAASFNDPPAVASNGSTTLVVWPQGSAQLDALTIAADGTVTGPFTLIDTTCVGVACWYFASNALEVESDGTNFVVAYRTYIDEWDGGARDTRTEHVRTLRVDPTGQVLDAGPTDVASLVQTFSHSQKNYDAYLANVRLAWDGAGWLVLWSEQRENGNAIDTSTVQVRRLTSSNVPLAAAAQLYPTGATSVQQIVWPDVACVAPGDCLAAWIEWDGNSPDGGGLFVRNALGVRIVGGQPQPGTPAVLLADVNYNDTRALRVEAHPGGYGLLATRNSCAPSSTTFCGWDLIGGLATATGGPVDTAGVRLNQRPDGADVHASPYGLAFDGTSFVAAFVDYYTAGPWDYTAWPQPLWPGYAVFAARFSTTGVALDSEPIGRLVHPLPTALGGRIVRSGASLVVVWEDNRHPGPVERRSYWAQRIALD